MPVNRPYRRLIHTGMLLSMLWSLFPASQPAAAQSDQSNKTVEQAIAPDTGLTHDPQTPQIKTALPQKASSSADFMPVAAQSLSIQPQLNQVVTAQLDSAKTTAVQFEQAPLSLLVEADTFAPATRLEFQAQALPSLNQQLQRNSKSPGYLRDQAEQVTLYRFNIEAQTNDQAADFKKPVRMVLDLRQLMRDVPSNYQNFYLAYQDEADPNHWIEVPITLHDAKGLISADVGHFSTWAAGTRPERWNPSWVPAAVASFSGAATYAYPIEAPMGRGGLQPKVELSYNSRSLDGRIRDDTGAGPLGDAWSISDISIARVGVKTEFVAGFPSNNHPDNFRLTINGAGHELFPEFPNQTATASSMRYFAKDAPGYYIKRVYSTATPNTDGIYWIVVTPTGVTYRLGYYPHAEEHQVWNIGYWNVQGHQGRPNNERSALAWHVDTVTDRAGNQMTYQYVNWTVTEPIEWYPEGSSHKSTLQLTTWKSRIGSISYNYPNRVTALPVSDTVAQLSTTPASRLVFTTKTQFAYLIDTIYVYHGSLTTPIKEYRVNLSGHFVDSPDCMNQDTQPNIPRSTHTRVINAITVASGVDANPATEDGWTLPATTFTYEAKPHYNNNCFYFYYLKSMRSNYGGEISFNYASDNRWIGEYKYLGYDRYVWPTLGQSYYVVETLANDGRNPAVKTTYSYSQPCYGQWSSNVPAGAITCGASDAPEFGTITGFATVNQRSYDFNGTTLLKRNETIFSQNSATTSGKPMIQRNFAGDGTLLDATHSTYNTDSLNGLPNMFTYLSEVKRYQYSNGLEISTKRTFGYDVAKQAGVQYGNLTDTWLYASAAATTPYEKQVIYYTPNNGRATGGQAWIVNAPTASGRYDQQGTFLNGTWTYYDGASTNATAPTQGLVTRSRQTRPITCAEIPNPSGLPQPADFNCVHAFQTIDSDMTYDSFGNPKTTTIYSGFGYRSLKANFSDSLDWKPTETGQPNLSQVATLWYDSDYNLYPVKTTNAANQATTYEIYGFRNDAGNIAAVDGFQIQTGLLKSITNPDATVVRYEYDPFGRLVNTFDSYDFTGFGDSTKWNGNPVIRYRYWDNHWNDSVIFANPAANQPFLISDEKRPGSYANPSSTGNFAYNDQTMYDGFGRAIQTRHIWADVDGQAKRQEIYSTTAYNALGQMICQTAPFNLPFYSDRGLVWPASPFVTTPCIDSSMAKTLTSYDNFGRVKQTTAADGSLNKANWSLVNNITVAGQNLFWQHQQINPKNQLEMRLINNQEQLVLRREYRGPSESPIVYSDTQFQYDTLGNINKISRRQPTNAGNGALLAPEAMMIYNGFGHKLQINDPDMGTIKYRYNANARIIEQRTLNDSLLSSDDDVVCFYFDALQRNTSKNTTNVGANCPNTPILNGALWLANSTYYTSGAGKIGKLAGVKWNRDGLGAIDGETFDYNSLGSITSHTRTLNGVSFSMQFGGFDALNRATTMTYPDGEVATITHDLEGENSLSLGDHGTLVANVEYNARGNISLIDRANGGHNTVFNYYGATGTANTGNSNFRLASINHQHSLLPSYTYEYDQIGNISLLYESGSLSGNTYFNYDELNRLTSTSGIYTHIYAYDKLGNLTNNNGITQTYNGTGNQPHALRSTSQGNFFEYDQAGNMIVRNDASGLYQQAFDVEQRLYEVIDQHDQTTRFRYDPSGQRTTTFAADGTVTYDPFPNYQRTTVSTSSPSVDSLNAGILCSDYNPETRSYSGAGYIMYSEIPVKQRFGNLPVANISEHFICVRNNAGVWEYDNDAGFYPFTPIASDLLVANFNYDGTTVNPYLNQSGAINGLRYGYTTSNMAFSKDVFGGASNPGEFQIAGTHFKTYSFAQSVANHGYGVACQEDATGTGYLMYSAESVHSRFAEQAPFSNNAAHFICVRHNGQTWQYDNNSAYFAFTPRQSDRLIGAIDFSNDSYTSYVGQTGTILGIQKGLSSSNLTITVNQWNGESNPGEFGIAGLNFTPQAYEVTITSAGMGINCLDTATGTGYIMHSRQALNQRFSQSIPAQLASKHFVCVRYHSTSSTWQYDDGSNYHGFTPRPSDTLVASVNFSTDQVTSLAGTTDNEFGITKGFASSISIVANQWGGNSNAGEFQVIGNNLTTHTIDIASKTVAIAGTPIATRRNHSVATTLVDQALVFVYVDKLGSANTLMDQTGTAILNNVRYLPFGEERLGLNSAYSDRGFTGHQENRDLGLTYMNARFYLPGTGRFISADSMIPEPSNPQSFNRYSYVYNNPINATDPSGHLPGDDEDEDLTALPSIPPPDDTSDTVPAETPYVEPYDDRAKRERLFWMKFRDEYIFRARLHGTKPFVVLVLGDKEKVSFNMSFGNGVSVNTNGDISASFHEGLIGYDISYNDLSGELTETVLFGPQIGVEGMEFSPVVLGVSTAGDITINSSMAFGGVGLNLTVNPGAKPDAVYVLQISDELHYQLMGDDPCALSVSFQDQQAAWGMLQGTMESYGFDPLNSQWSSGVFPGYAVQQTGYGATATVNAP